MRPFKIPSEILNYINGSISTTELCEIAFRGYQSISHETPEVTIIIPAYNEEASIAATLASLCQNQTNRSVEIIVVDNNSADRTKDISFSCGVNCIFQMKQGITFARNLGLENARGKYILNADADSIYPKDWIEKMTSPLEDEKIALTYGRFGLIPEGKTKRVVYFFYEQIAEFSRWINKNVKDESVNVYGFNSGFRKEQGLLVAGFDHPQGTNEDGWLALKLREKGFGRLYLVKDPKALVWTSDRRITLDGGIFKATLKRIKRMLRL